MPFSISSLSSSTSNDSHEGSKEGTSTARKEPPLPTALRSAPLQRRRRRLPLPLLCHSNNKDRLSDMGDHPTTSTSTSTTNNNNNNKVTEDQHMRPSASFQSVKARRFPVKFLKKYLCFKAAKRSTIKTTEPVLSIIENADDGSAIKPPEPGLSVHVIPKEGIVDEKYRFDLKHFARPDDESPFAAVARFMATKPPCFYQHESSEYQHGSSEYLEESVSFF